MRGLAFESYSEQQETARHRSGARGFSVSILSMIGENPLVVTDEPVEFENQPVEVGDRRLINDHFRGIFRMNPN